MKTKSICLVVVLYVAWAVQGCGGGGNDCTPNAKTLCREGVTYWVDSCGNEGNKAGDCECGCNTDFSGCKTPCDCAPSCGGKECGPDGCGGTCSPGCNAGEKCNETTGQCECVPNCNGKECGPDGCGGTCTPGCGSGEICNESTGQCVGCAPVCVGKECGDDGCGGTCAPGCGSGELCNDGTCEAANADIVWVQISGGTFQMGSTAGDPNEQPVHGVTVPSFEMSKTEITVYQYQACVNAGTCTSLPIGGHCNWSDDHPANCMDWNQAVVFCAWVGGRLPTEAEWEYAARSGGQDIIYPWGDELATCNYAVMSQGGRGCGRDSTWPVCSKPAGNNVQGLCDMAGNVFELVQDCYHGSYDCDANPSATNCASGGIAPNDGSAWETPVINARVFRGGAWGYPSEFQRASIRGRGLAGSDSVGFRCVDATP